MHEALHGEMTRHYPTLFWMINNILTGGSYIIIAYCILRGWYLSSRFFGEFAMFILACGVHHVVHSIPGGLLSHDVIANLQIVADTTMTTISVYAAFGVSVNWIHQKRERSGAY